ncbi:MAG: adenylosuccinate synthase [Mollicutes bacterium]|nr:adenylosuccinate synthase [Mollicutes bacterium]
MLALQNIDEIYSKVLTPKCRTLVVLGSGWGDEGKGKITNYLSEQSDYVVRFQGGDNAGHTIQFNGKTFKLHLIPSGIFDGKIKNVLGNGMVINPEALVEELNTIKQEGFVCNNLFISDRAHVIFNYHKELDRCNEMALANRKIGTTLKGIGPAYTDKVSRQGLRMVDFISDDFSRLFRENATAKNEIIKSMGGSPIDVETSLQKYLEISKIIKPMVVDTIDLINKAYDENKKILFEGAQGSLLDIDFGTYPFVTSSNPSSGGVSTGTGISPTKIEEVLAIVKAYSTRVGSGAFPTELFDELGNSIREKAHEYGATTKRPRRIGWLDGVALRYSTNINGFTSISLMLLDILSGIEKIKICTAYELDGKKIYTIPASLKDYERCIPVYEEFDGWTEDISHVTSFDELPENAKKYIEGIERITKVPVKIFSVGPDKTQTIVREEIY